METNKGLVCITIVFGICVLLNVAGDYLQGLRMDILEERIVILEDKIK